MITKHPQSDTLLPDSWFKWDKPCLRARWVSLLTEHYVLQSAFPAALVLAFSSINLTEVWQSNRLNHLCKWEDWNLKLTRHTVRSWIGGIENCRTEFLCFRKQHFKSLRRTFGTVFPHFSLLLFPLHGRKVTFWHRPRKIQDSCHGLLQLTEGVLCKY